MPLGLPGHLVSRTVIHAYSKASHTVAAVCIAAAFLTLCGLQASDASLTLWPAGIALVPMAVLLFLLDRRPTPFMAAAYLLVGAACVYWYAVTGIFEYAVAGRSDAFMLLLPKLALVFVAGGSSAVPMILWAAAGFIAAEGAVALAAVSANGSVVPDGATIASFLVIMAAIFLATFRPRFAVNVQSSFTRASREEQLATVRYRMEGKAAAIMHDTVLGHLAAISASAPGALSPDLRRHMSDDLDFLIGGEWLVEERTPDAKGMPQWRQSELFAVIEEAEQLGLTIDVSGDVSAFALLDWDGANAIALAAKQCLINVVRHSGVSNAEVVIYGSETDVSVMIIDAGAGFTESETASDRLGIRQSVRGRIDAVGGAVQIWSTPGRGTSVMLRVPTRQADDAAEVTP
jgi:signal transduction histidine kinase